MSILQGRSDLAGKVDAEVPLTPSLVFKRRVKAEPIGRGHHRLDRFDPSL